MDMLSNFELIFLTIFGVSLLIQLFYYLYFYIRIVSPPPTPVVDEKPPVSVIICARDEEENLQTYLPKVLEQEYPEFEVIVVDDCSSDDTETVLRTLAAKYPVLKYTRILKDEKFLHGKKLALTVGIKSAKYECLLFTDADCYPESRHWLASMSAHFTKGASVVLGYGGYVYKKGLLNNLIRFDGLFIALQYLTYAMRGFPYMGVGRNLAYQRSLFFKNKGFSSHYHLASGDDDLFVSEVANRRNTAVEYHREAHTRTLAKETFYNWIQQKKRHLTTSTHYSAGIILLLGLEPLSRIIYYGSFVILMVSLTFYPYVLAAFGLRLLFQIISIKYATKYLNEKYLLLSSLLYDILLPFIYLGLVLSNMVNRRKYQWT